MDQPTTPQLRGSADAPNCEMTIGPDVFRQVVGGVSAWPVDTFGVVVEASAGVDEDQHRSRTAVRLGVLVDHGIALPVRIQLVGLLNSPAIIITAGSSVAGRPVNQIGGR